MDSVNASNEDDMNKGLGQRMSEGNAAQVDDYNSEVDELCTKVEKMDTMNASNEDDKNKGLRQRTSEGNAAQVDDYNSEVDELCTKVDKMDTVNASNEDVTNKTLGQRMSEGNAAQVDDYNNEVDEIFTKVDKLEQTVNEIEQFYSNTKLKEPNTSRGALIIKDKEKEKQIPSMKKLQQDASRREAAAAKRMQELMRQFGSIFRQITQHKWAWPFMQPVDVEGLGLHDYYQIIDRPMDFSTIKNQMEAKDGTGYKHVHEICSDMRLVFKNAMKYNDEKSNVHVMAKTLLEKFEEKWLQFLPKVIEEEKRREEEEAEAQINAQLAQEAAHAKLAREVNNELNAIDMRLEELRDMVVKRCRRMSTVEKRELGAALTILSPEDLTKALEIVARANPNFQATAEEVEIDINAQSESTLWRLKFFVKDALKRGSKTSSKDDNKNITPTDEDDNNIVSIRRREICDALAKTAKKRKNNKNITPTDKDNNNIVSKHKRQISNTLIKAAMKRKRKSSS